MASSLDKMTIRGFKSIKSLENFELKNLNVLIGANGAGKSNFIDFFRLLRAMMGLSLPEFKKTNLQTFIVGGGGIDDFLFNGPKETEDISAELHFGMNGYKFSLAPAGSSGDVMFADEQDYFERGGWWDMGSGHTSPKLLERKDERGARGAEHGVGYHVFQSINSWRIYHFHDTRKTAEMRRGEIVQDNKILRFDASNIAPFLLRLKGRYPAEYKEILDAVRLVAPFFDDFLLDIREFGKFGEKEKVNLSWQQKGSDYPMQPYHLSDGTIRFICLATALLQPHPPSTIIIDEPELGLHPTAINILAELIQDAAKRTQLIVATQSPPFIDNFNVEDVVVVNREDGASTFERLAEEDLRVWLEEYSVGELWKKNVISGGPVYE